MISIYVLDTCMTCIHDMLIFSIWFCMCSDEVCRIPSSCFICITWGLGRNTSGRKIHSIKVHHPVYRRIINDIAVDHMISPSLSLLKQTCKQMQSVLQPISRFVLHVVHWLVHGGNRFRALLANSKQSAFSPATVTIPNYIQPISVCLLFYSQTLLQAVRFAGSMPPRNLIASLAVRHESKKTVSTYWRCPKIWRRISWCCPWSMLLQHAQQVHLSTVQVIPIFGPVTRHLQLIMIQIGYTSSIFTSCCDMRFLPGASSTPMLCQSDGEEQPQVNYSAKAELETHQTWIFLLQHDPTFCHLAPGALL